MSIDDLSSFRAIFERTIPESIKNTGIMEEIRNVQQKDSNEASYILSLCKIITNHIEIQLKDENNEQRGIKYKMKRGGRGNSYANLMTFGAQLLYALRLFVNHDHLYFLFGTSYQEEGQGKSRQVVDLDEDVMKNFSAFAGKKSKNGYIGLMIGKMENSLSNISTMDLMNTNIQQRINIWQDVSELGKFEKNDNTKPENFKIREHEVFRSIKNDKNVLCIYSGKNSRRSLYYEKSKNNYQFFNQGWLYEWYNTALHSWNDTWYQNLENSVNIGSIYPLFFKYKGDSIPGLKQGDFVSSNSQQIQTKFNNQKIISYYNILKVIHELELALSPFVDPATSGASQTTIEEKLIQTLEKNFIPNATNEASAWGKKQKDELIRNLLNKIPNNST